MASKLLDIWRDPAGIDPPFVDEFDLVESFLLGSIAPDMGYYPGGVPLYSDLAHCLGSSDLARHLIALVRSDVDRAFALGWMAHILGDVLIHPLINRHAGEQVMGARNRSLSYADAPSLHRRIEIGVEAALMSNSTPSFRISRTLNSEASHVALLRDAYSATYGIPVDPREMRASYRSLIRFSPWLIRSIRLHSGHPRAGSSRRGATRPLIRGLGALSDLITPISPPNWLVRELVDLIEAFPSRFLAFNSAGLDDLMCYNLDTGSLESEDPTYPITVAALDALKSLGGEWRRTR